MGVAGGSVILWPPAFTLNFSIQNSSYHLPWSSDIYPESPHPSQALSRSWAPSSTVGAII